MLSIIIPTLNEEKYLPLLLEAIKKQKVDEHSFISTHRSARVFDGDLEIIVADAGSEDRTVEIAKSYGCKIIPGGLPAKGRNEGARVARGDLLLFLDADVILPENFLEKILKEFEERNLDIITSLIEPLTNKRTEKFLYQWLYNLPIRFSEGFLPHASHLILVKRKLHEKIGGFDEEIKLAEDHIYGRKGAKMGRFGILKSAKILASPRRFYQDGWAKTYLKYLLAGVHMIFLGPVKSDIFKYRFNHYLKKEKK